MRLIPRVVLPVVATMMAITALALMPSGSALAYPGADNLSIQQQCQSPNNVQIGLFWTTYNLGEQWVDVSLNNNNFAPGTFLSNGPVAANVDHVVGSGIQTGVTLYVRVNTQTPSGWYSSPTLAFTTISDCSTAVIVPVPAPLPVPVPVPVGPPVVVPVPIPGPPVPVPMPQPPMVTPY
jgi:hypothetical protein